MTTAARAWPTSLAALDHRPYRAFAGGALVSGTANWMVRLAQTLLLIDLTNGSAAAVGLLAAVQYLPILLFGTHVGVLADRRSKPLMLGSGQLVMALAAMVQAMLLAVGVLTVATVFSVAFCFGIGAAIDNTLRLSLAPELVPAEQIANAVSLNTVSLQVGRLLGPAIGGLLVAALGFAPVFVIGSVAFVVFAALLRLLARRRPATAGLVASGGVREGLRYARRDHALLVVLALVGVGGLVGPNLALLATVMVHDVFHGGPIELGVVTGVLAFGTAVGAFSTARRTAFRVSQVGVATAAVGVLSAVTALAPNPVVYAVLLAPAGAAALSMVTTASALIQTEVAPAFRGRITGLYAIVLVVGVPVGSPLIGALADAVGVRVSTVLAGMLVVAVAASLTLLGGADRQALGPDAPPPSAA